MTADDWTKVSALATAATALIAGIAVLVAVWQLRVQGRLTRYTTGFDALWKLTAEWDSPRMERVRRAASKAIANDQETPDIEDVLDFFELVGLLVERGVVEDELAWNQFYHYLAHYWRLTRDYIERIRRDEPTIYENVVALVQHFDDIEAKRSRRPATAIVPTPEELSEFVADEQRVG